MPPSPAAAIIAVIPFAIINGVPEQEYFADGTWRN
jgi:TolB-like protein